MTTVGCDDVAPGSAIGKLLTVVRMINSVLLTANVTSTMTNAFEWAHQGEYWIPISREKISQIPKAHDNFLFFRSRIFF